MGLPDVHVLLREKANALNERDQLREKNQRLAGALQRICDWVEPQFAGNHEALKLLDELRESIALNGTSHGEDASGSV